MDLAIALLFGIGVACLFAAVVAAVAKRLYASAPPDVAERLQLWIDHPEAKSTDLRRDYAYLQPAFLIRRRRDLLAVGLAVTVAGGVCALVSSLR